MRREAASGTASPPAATVGAASEVVIRSGAAPRGSKTAVTFCAASIPTTQRLPEGASHPRQRVKRKPGLGRAVRVRRVPEE